MPSSQLSAVVYLPFNPLNVLLRQHTRVEAHLGARPDPFRCRALSPPMRQASAVVTSVEADLPLAPAVAPQVRARSGFKFFDWTVGFALTIEAPNLPASKE